MENEKQNSLRYGSTFHEALRAEFRAMSEEEREEWRQLAVEMVEKVLAGEAQAEKEKTEATLAISVPAAKWR